MRRHCFGLLFLVLPHDSWAVDINGQWLRSREIAKEESLQNDMVESHPPLTVKKTTTTEDEEEEQEQVEWNQRRRLRGQPQTARSGQGHEEQRRSTNQQDLVIETNELRSKDLSRRTSTTTEAEKSYLFSPTARSISAAEEDFLYGIVQVPEEAASSTVHAAAAASTLVESFPPPTTTVGVKDPLDGYVEIVFPHEIMSPQRSPLDEDQLYGVVQQGGDKNEVTAASAVAINTHTSPLDEDNLYGVVYTSKQVQSHSVVHQNSRPASPSDIDPSYGFVEVVFPHEKNSPMISSPLDEDQLYGIEPVDKNELMANRMSLITRTSPLYEDNLYGVVLSTHQEVQRNSVVNPPRTIPVVDAPLFGFVNVMSPLRSPLDEDHLYGVVDNKSDLTVSPMAVNARSSPLDEDHLYGIVDTEANVVGATAAENVAATSWHNDHLHGIVYAEDYAASKTLSAHPQNLHV
jgi:hypothetical protein